MTPMKPRLLSLLAVLGCVIAGMAAVTHADGGAKELMKSRHHKYHDLGDAFKTIRDEVRRGAPDLAKVKSAAQVVKQASVDQFSWFPQGTGAEAGKTRAKAEIWTQPQAFETAQKRFADEAPKLLALTQVGDVKGLQQQFKVVGKTCADCHDRFRAEEDHKH